MPDQKIVEYIKSQLGAGFDINKIRNDLLMNGNLPSEVDLAFSSLNNNTPNLNTPTPVNPTPTLTEQPIKNKGSLLKKILVTIVVLILTGGISVGAYFSYSYYKDNQITSNNKITKANDILEDSQKPRAVTTPTPEIVKESVGSISYGPAVKFGILSVQKTANMSVAKGAVNVDGKLQTSTTFQAGKSYTINLSGVKGFTEFTQYGAPAKFVDFTGKFTVYNENNKVIKNIDNILSSYVGGIPVADAEELQVKLNIPANFPVGNYRWEFIITDNKNPENSIKAVVSFKV